MSFTVLTIEDQDDLRRLIRMALEFDAIDVIEATNGRDGLRLAKEKRPALILLDVMMPGMDGLEVARQLQADPATRGIPTLFLSAKGARHDIEQGLATGVSGYIVKPFSPIDLLDKVHALVEASRARAGGVGA